MKTKEKVICIPDLATKCQPRTKTTPRKAGLPNEAKTVRRKKALFDNVDRLKSQRLMRVIDSINARLNSPLQWAAEGSAQSWKVKFKRRSCRYTTR